MSRKFLTILTILQMCFILNASSQEIWRESFTIPGKGIWGAGDGTVISDFEGIEKWSLIYDENTLSLENEGDYAKTVSTSGGRFEVCDIDGEVVWISEQIDISGFEKVNLELVSAETGSGANTATKYMKIFYRIDDGEELLFHENGENAGNWGSVTAGTYGVSGKFVQIICYLSNHYAADKVILDEVVVAAEEKYFPPAEPGELLLNEVLFNPYPGGADYVEIYNNSEREIPLGKQFLATRKKNLELTQVYDLSGKIYLLPPKSYVAVTNDTNAVFPFYQIECSECFQQVARIASFNNDDDYVVLLNENMEVLDELHYTKKMHTPFLSDVKGVSLERVSLKVPAGVTGNWYSASSDAGYGTPGYENSQTDREFAGKPKVTFEPKAFSPNHDGYNDEFFIRYELEKPGYVANIKIFDSAGRFVMNLIKNEILGTGGEFVWNGSDETGSRRPLGVYVVYMEVFNSEGELYRYKTGVVLTDVLD